MNAFVMAYMEYKVEAECERVANISYCENANDDDVSFVLKMLCCAAYGWLHNELFNLGIILTQTNSTFLLSFFYYTGMRGPVLHQHWRRRQPNASTYHAMGQDGVVDHK